MSMLALQDVVSETAVVTNAQAITPNRSTINPLAAHVYVADESWQVLAMMSIDVDVSCHILEGCCNLSWRQQQQPTKKTRNSLGLRILRPSYSECASSPTECIEKPVAGNGFISENFTQGCDWRLLKVCHSTSRTKFRNQVRQLDRQPDFCCSG